MNEPVGRSNRTNSYRIRIRRTIRRKQKTCEVVFRRLIFISLLIITCVFPADLSICPAIHPYIMSKGVKESKSNGMDPESVGDKPQKRQMKHDSGAADLEKVTDYMEDSEISSQNIAQVSFVNFAL